MKRKDDNRHRSWMLTVPATGGSGISRSELLRRLEVYPKICGQLEKGDSGYLHWQLLLESDNPIRFSTLKKRFPTAHIEPTRSREAAYKYVTKVESRVPGELPIRKGTFVLPRPGKRTDVEHLWSSVRNGTNVDELLLQEPAALRFEKGLRAVELARDKQRFGQLRTVTTEVHFGKTGAGKTFSLYADRAPSDVCRVTTYGTGRYDGYSAHPVLALDEFTGGIPIGELLCLADVYPMSLPARYQDKPACYGTLLLLSNIPPWHWYPEEPLEVRLALCRRLNVVVEHLTGPPDFTTRTVSREELERRFCSPDAG